MAGVMFAMLLYAGQAVDDVHVRSSSSAIRLLCQEAQEQSVLFTALVKEVNASDVVVYIEPYTRLSTGLAGAVNFDVVTRGGVRYVRVLVSPLGARERRMGIIAHELQHIVEIAHAPEATDVRTVEQLFRRIGFARSGHSYETTQAQSIESLVLAEITTTRRPRSTDTVQASGVLPKSED